MPASNLCLRLLTRDLEPLREEVVLVTELRQDGLATRAEVLDGVQEKHAVPAVLRAGSPDRLGDLCGTSLRVDAAPQLELSIRINQSHIAGTQSIPLSLRGRTRSRPPSEYSAATRVSL